MAYPQPYEPRLAPPPSPWRVLGGTVAGLGDRLLGMNLDERAKREREAQVAKADQRYDADVAYRDQQATLDQGRWLTERAAQGQTVVPMERPVQDVSEAVASIEGSFAPLLPFSRKGPSLGDRLATNMAAIPGIGIMETDPMKSVQAQVAATERDWRNQDYTRQRADTLADRTREESFEERMTRLAAALRPPAQAPAPNYARIPAAEGGGAWDPRTGQVIGGGPAPAAPGTVDERRANDAAAALRALAADPSPAGDLAFKTLYMKVLDPQSVVREGELDMLTNAGSFVDRLRERGSQATTGMLTPERRADMLSQAEAILAARSGAGGAPTVEAAGVLEAQRADWDRLAQQFGEAETRRRIGARP
jgi:hypothetical protein